jgi:hypothetical protein
MEEKSFITLSPEPTVIKHIMSVIYEARVLVPGRPFQPILMFVNKNRDYLSEAPFICSTVE